MKESLLPATLLTCSIFSCLTLPLAIFGAQSVQIELQKEHVFAGRLKDVATPYLGIAASLSLGAGLVSLSLSEWRKSSRKEAKVQEQLFQLQQKLQEKETQLETLQLSEPVLRAKGFEAFLEPDLVQNHAAVEPIVPVASEIVADSMVEVVKAPRQRLPITQTAVDKVAQSVPAAAVTPPATSTVEAMVAAAQPMPQPLAPVMPVSAAVLPKETAAASLSAEPLSVWQQARSSATGTVLAQIDHLQTQLKQMAAHVETLQSSLLLTAEAPMTESIEASPLVIEHLHRRLQRLETDLLRSRIAS